MKAHLLSAVVPLLLSSACSISEAEDAASPGTDRPTLSVDGGSPATDAGDGGAVHVFPDAGAPRASLKDPAKREIAFQLVSSAENSSLDWRAQYGYIEDLDDGRGYTAGLVGFCSGTGDMLELVQHLKTLDPLNVLVKYLPSLEAVNGTDSHAGLDPGFTRDWKTAAGTEAFRQAQEHERDRVYFNPAVSQAIADGLGALGQFIYYDSLVFLGPGNGKSSQGGVRLTALSKSKSPAQGGDEVRFLSAYLDAYRAAILTDPANPDTDRIDTEARVFLNAGNLELTPPLRWKTFGDSYVIP